MVETLRTALAFLQLIGLLLPVLAILVQITVNSYDDSEPRPARRVLTLSFEILGGLALVLAAWILTTQLEEINYPDNVKTALLVAKFGFVAIGGAIVFVAGPYWYRSLKTWLGPLVPNWISEKASDASKRFGSTRERLTSWASNLLPQGGDDG